VPLLVLVASVGLRRHRGLGLPPGGFAYLVRERAGEPTPRGARIADATRPQAGAGAAEA